MATKKIIIEALVDDSCEMATVKVDDKHIMTGNFWDFHPGCHGINEYGDFRGFANLVQVIYLKLIKDGNKASDIEIRRTNYKYQ